MTASTGYGDAATDAVYSAYEHEHEHIYRYVKLFMKPERRAPGTVSSPALDGRLLAG